MYLYDQRVPSTSEWKSCSVYTQIEVLEVSTENQPLPFRGVQSTVHRVYYHEGSTQCKGSVSLNNTFVGHQSRVKKS